jgi:hypothetical protein
MSLCPAVGAWSLRLILVAQELTVLGEPLPLALTGRSLYWRECAMTWNVEILAAKPITPFEFRCPDGVKAFEGEWMVDARVGRRHAVRHGLGARPVYGRERVHTVTWVDGQVQVEGVEADDYPASQAVVSNPSQRPHPQPRKFSRHHGVPEGTSDFWERFTI